MPCQEENLGKFRRHVKNTLYFPDSKISECYMHESWHNFFLNCSYIFCGEGVNRQAQFAFYEFECFLWLLNCDNFPVRTHVLWVEDCWFEMSTFCVWKELNWRMVDYILFLPWLFGGYWVYTSHYARGGCNRLERG